MPLLAVLGTAISFLSGFFVVRALGSMGLGIVAYIGIQGLYHFFESEMLSAYNGLPPAMYAIATMAGLDVAIKILLWAVATSWSIATVGAGATALLKFTGLDAPE